MCKHDSKCADATPCVTSLNPGQTMTVLATRLLPNGEFEATPAVVRTDADVAAQLTARQLLQLNQQTNERLFR